jgi:hypothetical protein
MNFDDPRNFKIWTKFNKIQQNSTKLSKTEASKVISFLPYNYRKLIKDKEFAYSMNFDDLLN